MGVKEAKEYRQAGQNNKHIITLITSARAEIGLPVGDALPLESSETTAGLVQKSLTTYFREIKTWSGMAGTC